MGKHFNLTPRKCAKVHILLQEGYYGKDIAEKFAQVPGKCLEFARKMSEGKSFHTQKR